MVFEEIIKEHKEIWKKDRKVLKGDEKQLKEYDDYMKGWLACAEFIRDELSETILEKPFIKKSTLPAKKEKRK